MIVGDGPEEVNTEYFMAKKIKTRDIDLKDSLMRSAIEDIINQKIDTKMYYSGYSKENNIYIPKKAKTVKTEDGRPFLVYENGCRYQIEVLPTGYILVWIDPKGRIKQRASDFIDWMDNFSDKSSIEEKIIGEKVGVEPYSTTGEIKGIRWNKTVSSEKIPASGWSKDYGKDELTLKEYWQEERNIQLKDDEGPILEIKLNSREKHLSYPPSKVYITTQRKSIPKKIRKEFAYASVKRVGKTERLAKTMLGNPINLGDATINFDLKMAPEDKLKEIGKLIEVGKIDEPSFLVGGAKRTDNLKDIRKEGPFSGSKGVSIHYVYPEDVKFDIDSLHCELSKNFEQYNLGTLNMIGRTKVSFTGEDPDRNDYSYATSKAIDDIEKVSDSNPIIFSITKGDQGTYAGGKQESHDKNYPIQNITEKNAKSIANGSNDGYYKSINTLIQVYLKTLDKGEAPWILNSPAGMRDGTAYVGYDVSRRQNKDEGKRREAAATVSMVDNLGRHISNKFYNTQSGEKLDKSSAKRLIFDLSRSADKTFAEYGDELKRMVVFKDGTIRNHEKQNVLDGAEESIDTILSKPDLPDKIGVELIGVVKSNIERIYQDNGYNPERGRYVIYEDGTGIICSSHLNPKRNREVTVQTTKLEPKFRITEDGKGNVDMKSILKEFSDLCFLDWGSIFHQPKYPIVLKLAQQLGEQYTLNIGDPSYLPL
ncbi:MAG: hypothetical protein ACOC53_07720 [Candidatus Saliniplasma sp.]